MELQPRIYCPLCEWVPDGNSLWYCAPVESGAGCHTHWNTFLTAGCCPGCGHFWVMTACLSCKQRSRHESWYHFPSGDERTRQIGQELEAVA